jgi:hypothetical protein
MMKKIFLLITLSLIMLGLSSCNNDDRFDWSPMKWRTETVVATPSVVKTITVPKEGGTFTFTCKNYSRIWLTEITEKTATGYDKYTTAKDINNVSISWMTASINGNTVTVEIKPNDKEERSADVGVTAGDIFDTFRFNQK